MTSCLVPFAVKLHIVYVPDDKSNVRRILRARLQQTPYRFRAAGSASHHPKHHDRARKTMMQWTSAADHYLLLLPRKAHRGWCGARDTLRALQKAPAPLFFHTQNGETTTNAMTTHHAVDLCSSVTCLA